jgi:hypothetical protein
MIKNRIIKLIVAIIALFIATPVLAVQINMQSEAETINVSERLWVDVMLDTQGEIINAISGTVSYSKDKLILVDYNNGDSIITLWIDQPDPGSADTSFAGVTPGGFSGVLSPMYSGTRAGKVISFQFEVIKGGLFEIGIDDMEVLLHDGSGTLASTSIESLNLEATENIIISPSKDSIAEDLDPPEPFIFKVIRDEGIADDKFVVVFNTVDKGSGIDFYEIKEGNKPFEHATSPYVLNNQHLDGAIVVRAVDKAGNIQASRVGPPRHRGFLEKYGKWGIIILLIIVIVVSYFLRRKYSNNEK